MWGAVTRICCAVLCCCMCGCGVLTCLVLKRVCAGVPFCAVLRCTNYLWYDVLCRNYVETTMCYEILLIHNRMLILYWTTTVLVNWNFRNLGWSPPAPFPISPYGCIRQPICKILPEVPYPPCPTFDIKKRCIPPPTCGVSRTLIVLHVLYVYGIET
jgi:hypothetical protein